MRHGVGGVMMCRCYVLEPVAIVCVKKKGKERKKRLEKVSLINVSPEKTFFRFLSLDLYCCILENFDMDGFNKDTVLMKAT